MPDEILKKIYIVQFRTDASEPQEQDCYNEELKACGYDLFYVNAAKGELPEFIPEDVAGVIMGGSGQFYLSTEEVKNNEWIRNTLRFIDSILEKNIPLMGVCYGGHLLSFHQGADLSTDEKFQEVGTFQVELLPDSEKDPIFSRLKSTFLAQFGHKTTPINLPSHLLQLAKTKKVSCQAFRLKNKPAWGLMFHPELNQERMRARLKLFPNYVPKGTTMEELLEDFKDTPEAAKVLHLFVDYVSEQQLQKEKIKQKKAIQIS
ncbi:MAG: hypothetical protein GF349_00150 [Candidatus Magasanikbacteria bacterium]|nr:hypothetical protein [Candidatus Magasanikbacteria bacterium]